MYLRESKRIKDGKAHRYWSVVESKRVSGGKVVQHTLLYLGEINDNQRAGWTRAIAAIDGETQQQLSLFPSDRPSDGQVPNAVQIELSKLELLRPRQWGGCWLGCELWRMLGLDEFWGPLLGRSRKGTEWLQVLKVLAVYRLLDPGSEWRLHRVWFEQSAMADLLGGDFRLASKNTLYRCLDKLVEHKDALCQHLKSRWETLFNAKFEVLLYDLTSTYFESPPPEDTTDKRRYGYSRDKRSDCTQVVIALIVTSDGLPLSYEVLPGNTRDTATLKGALKKIKEKYGEAKRTWVMDRGIPTEEVLAEMQAEGVQYIVGTPKGRLTKLEEKFLALPWQKVREKVEVKLLPHSKEVYLLARSHDRIAKERSMRRRKLKMLWNRLKALQARTLTRDALLKKVAVAEMRAGAAAKLVKIAIPNTNELLQQHGFTFALDKQKLRIVLRREGRYLLRSNLTDELPAVLWERYIQLTQVEEAFRNLKGDLAIRPIFHSDEDRIEAHIFVCFLAYCMHVTLKNIAKTQAPGLSPRAILEQMSAIQMLDVRVPTTDQRVIQMSRFTQPDKPQQLLLQQLKLTLPAQPPPKIYHSV